MELTSFDQLAANAPLMKQFMAANFDPMGLRKHQLQTNASLLTYDQWKDIDRTVTDVAKMRLSAAADLLALGTRPLGLGAVISQWQGGNRMDPAKITMDPRTLFDRDRVDYATYQVPIPFIGKEFYLTIRELAMAGSLQTDNAMGAAVAVNEAIEDMVINGASNIVVGGAPVYGYRTHPNRITDTLSQGFTAAADIYASIVEILSDFRAANFNGPYVLYVNDAQNRAMWAKEGVDRAYTVKARILETFREDGLQAIRVSDKVPAGQIVAVALNRMHMDMAVGQAVRTLQWDERGGMVTNFIVMAAMAPRIKPQVGTDGTVRAAIVHATIP